MAFSAHAEMREASEYEVKAAFMYNFLKFTEWPHGALDGTVNLCILGDDPFGNVLDSIEGKGVGPRKVEVYRYSSLKEVGKCHVMFISPSEKWRLDGILRASAGSGILTVGDTEGYAKKGVIINFFMENNRVRFEINLDAARRSGLRVNPHLLGLARIVREEY